jgi:hypothetical protein
MRSFTKNLGQGVVASVVPRADVSANAVAVIGLTGTRERLPKLAFRDTQSVSVERPGLHRLW